MNRSITPVAVLAAVLLVLGTMVAIVDPAEAASPPTPRATPRLPVDPGAADRADAPQACCTVTAIEAASGVVSARETASGRTFTFSARDRDILRGLRIGAPVYANFTTKQVSLDGKTGCCTILRVAATAKQADSRQIPHGPASQAPAALPVATLFAPKNHGFEFTNYFTGDILVDLPLIGRVDLGDTTYGLCGGMVFAALDTFKLDATAPDVPITPPPSGTQMRSYLYQRQMDSLSYEDWFLVRRLVAWMRKPLNDNTVPNPLADGGVNVVERGLIHLSKKEFQDKIRPELDAGRPATIVLVKASGEDMASNPKAAFSKNHQALAIGYRRHGNEWDIDVYDPNFPNTIQTLHVDGRYQTQKGSTSHTGSFRGFFRAPYKLDRPPWVQDNPAVAGQVGGFRVGRFPRGDSDN